MAAAGAPSGTPALLASGRIEPRKVIGSIDTSEFLVAIAASLGFLIALGSQGINPAWVLALLVGGVIAAPIAAWLVRKIPGRILGSAVGGLIVLTNVRTLIRSDWVGLADTPAEGLILGAIALVWAARHRLVRPGLPQRPGRGVGRSSAATVDAIGRRGRGARGRQEQLRRATG